MFVALIQKTARGRRRLGIRLYSAEAAIRSTGRLVSQTAYDLPIISRTR